MVITGDIGGTNLRLALFANGELLTSVKTPLFVGYNDNLHVISKQISDWKEQGLLTSTLKQACFAITGALDRSKQKLTNSINLVDWQGKDLITDLAEICNCRVRVENDTYCAAIAESKKQANAFWYVNWGTGIGGCLVGADKKIKAAEIGHMCVDMNGKRCRCGQVGCWDSLVSGKALEGKYHKQLMELSDREWYSAIEVFVIGLVNLYVSYPADIVLNGGIILAQQDKFSIIKEIFADKLRILSLEPQITISKYGDKAGIWGAYELVK